MSGRRWLAAAAFVCVVAVVVALRSRPHPIDVVHPVLGPAVESVYATGTVEATAMFPVATRTAARLLQLDVDEGDAVKKDQVLAELESTDLARAVEQAEADADLARKVLVRNRTLAKSEAVSQDVLDRSAAEVVAAQARVEASRALLSYLQLKAPADGRVIRRDGEVGQLISVNQAVFWLATDATPRITAEVDEEDIALVQTGQKALIRADAFPDRVFDGRVAEITPKGDPIARSFRVRIALPADTPLRIGMSAEADIVVRETASALLVPPSAVQDGQVWAEGKDHLERRVVKLGARGKVAIEVREGLRPENLIARDATLVPPGGDVRTRLSEWHAP